jgi:ribokinase
LGAPTELVARVGDDAFADSLLDFLSHERIVISGVRRLPDAPTGTALIVVDDSGDNTIVVVPGANHAVSQHDVEQLAFAEGDVVVLQYELPLEVVAATISRARAAGARTVLNPAPAQPTPPDLLAGADFVVVNQQELAFFSGQGDVVAGLHALRQRPEQVTIATLGPEGVTALGGEQVIRIPGRDVPVVDTTGAGDCFVGAFAAALCSWAEVDEALQFANVAASIAVQRRGAGPGMPYLSDVEAAG